MIVSLGGAIERVRLRSRISVSPKPIDACGIGRNVGPRTGLGEAGSGLDDVLPAWCSLEPDGDGAVAIGCDTQRNRLRKIDIHNLDERVGARQEIAVSKISRGDGI